MKLNNSLRLVYLINYLNQQSDASNVKTGNDIANYLYPYFGDISLKTIYKDIATLKNANFPIVQVHQNNHQGVYMAKNCLTLSECKLIMDSLTSNTFIPNKIMADILDKLSPLIKSNDLKLLTRQQYIPSNHVTSLDISNTITILMKAIDQRRTIQFLYFDIAYKNTKHYRKSGNYYLLQPYYIFIATITILMKAIDQRRTIQFLYFDIAYKNTKHYRKSGNYYLLQPYYIFIANSRYYVIGYDHKHKALVHYRLDKMDQIQLNDINQSTPLIDSVNKRIETSIHLFTGEYSNVNFSIQTNYLSVFADQFNDLMVIEAKESRYQINVTLQVNNALFAWLTHFDPHAVTLLGPYDVKQQYIKYLQSIVTAYQDMP